MDDSIAIIQEAGDVCSNSMPRGNAGQDEGEVILLLNFFTGLSSVKIFRFESSMSKSSMSAI